MADSLSEKIAIVTGGGLGLGGSLCRELARRGARVTVDINSAEARRAARVITGLGGQATASTVDVSRAEEVTRLVKETAAAHGRLVVSHGHSRICLPRRSGHVTGPDGTASQADSAGSIPVTRSKW